MGYRVLTPQKLSIFYFKLRRPYNSVVLPRYTLQYANTYIHVAQIQTSTYFGCISRVFSAIAEILLNKWMDISVMQQQVCNCYCTC